MRRSVLKVLLYFDLLLYDKHSAHGHNVSDVIDLILQIWRYRPRLADGTTIC